MKNSGFCYLGVVPVRKEPESQSEQVTQLLFGDTVSIIDEYTNNNNVTDSWLKIRNLYDDYEGWVDARNIIRTYNNILYDNYYIVSSPIAKIKMNDDIITIPMASKLLNKNFVIDNIRFSLTEGSVIHSDKLNPLLIKAVSLLYLNTPYQWGGKSILGLDCSGFTQNVFAFAGIKLKRDASQQALQGKTKTFSQMKAGDLCFFDNKQGHITHVGIFAGGDKIIHCSGKVRIDSLDGKGIKPYDNPAAYSHHLCTVKSFF